MTRVRVTGPDVGPGRNLAKPASGSNTALEQAGKDPGGAVFHEPARNGTQGAQQVYLRSLIRSQLRLALVIAGAFALICTSFSLLTNHVAWVLDLSIGPVPFAWLLIGVGLFPVILACAWLYNRVARRFEDRYRELSAEH